MERKKNPDTFFLSKDLLRVFFSNFMKYIQNTTYSEVVASQSRR